MTEDQLAARREVNLARQKAERDVLAATYLVELAAQADGLHELARSLTKMPAHEVSKSTTADRVALRMAEENSNLRTLLDLAYRIIREGRYASLTDTQKFFGDYLADLARR